MTVKPQWLSKTSSPHNQAQHKNANREKLCAENLPNTEHINYPQWNKNGLGWLVTF